MIDADKIEAEIPHLRRYARALLREREAADDLVQDTLERAWRKRSFWRPTGRLRSWLFRVLYRLYLDGRPRRARQRNNLIALEDAREARLSERARQEGMLHCRDVLAAIDTMPETQRSILLLVALEQPSYRDGAAMLGIRVGTFRSRLSRAREHLEATLCADGEEAESMENGHG